MYTCRRHFRRQIPMVLWCVQAYKAEEMFESTLRTIELYGMLFDSYMEDFVELRRLLREFCAFQISQKINWEGGG